MLAVKFLSRMAMLKSYITSFFFYPSNSKALTVNHLRQQYAYHKRTEINAQQHCSPWT